MTDLKKKTLVIYHNKDLDGIFSGAIAKKALEEKGVEPILYGWDYSEEFVLPELIDIPSCIIIDLSPPKDMIADICKMFEEVMIIDHHPSTATNVAEMGLPENLLVVFNKDYSAAEIGYSVLVGGDMDGNVNKSKLPWAVSLIGNYDVYRDYGKPIWVDYVLPFQMGMRLIATSPEKVPASLLNFQFDFPDDISHVISMGNTIVQYDEVITRNLLSRQSHEGKIEYFDPNDSKYKSFSTLFLNVIHPPANIISVLGKNEYDLICTYVYNAKRDSWNYSLRTDKQNIDCKEIAKAYGGGGHVKAAGFETSAMLFSNGNYFIPVAKSVLNEQVPNGVALVEKKKVETKEAKSKQAKKK